MVRFEHFELSRREDGSLHELGRNAMDASLVSKGSINPKIAV